MIEFIKKIFAKWFTKEEVIVLTEEIVEPVEEVELPTHCTGLSLDLKKVVLYVEHLLHDEFFCKRYGF